MCGIAGMFDPRGLPDDAELKIRGMLAAIRHRGPDQWGLFLGTHAALGSVRLSIVDVANGQQPIANGDESLWIVFNGEIFNHVELRAELEERGHRFNTHTDTEVVLRLYEERGAECLERLNGQFAFAIWNARDRTLFLARDRLGVRPLYYTWNGGAFVFASEIKGLVSSGLNSLSIDPVALGEVFAYWAPLPGRTAFCGIEELPPGHHFTVAGERGLMRRYWRLEFPPADETARMKRSADQVLEEFGALLTDAVRLRLRADVPVGAYLSGGLDSSVIAALVREIMPGRLTTFSIAFTDAGFDERAAQRRMAEFLGTEHQCIEASYADVGREFPEVVRHAEVPILRTAPGPMLLLSRLVQRKGFKVVLTGEGADEFLAGYDLFKEAKIRRFWARQPASRVRPLLVRRLYPEIFGGNGRHGALLQAFFGVGLQQAHEAGFSHALRWANGRRNWRFFSAGTRAALGDSLVDDRWKRLLPADFNSWDALAQAQFLEISIFLSQYLLSSQGDRMAMASSVEGRFPFLDHRLVTFCNRLPPRLKLPGLKEKFLLRRFANSRLPADVSLRRKRPYRAPIHRSFFQAHRPEYVDELLSRESLGRAGWFDPAAVRRLVARLESGSGVGESDDMALAGILSTQLLQSQFIDHFDRTPPLVDDVEARICRRVALAERRS